MDGWVNLVATVIMFLMVPAWLNHTQAGLPKKITINSINIKFNYRINFQITTFSFSDLCSIFGRCMTLQFGSGNSNLYIPPLTLGLKLPHRSFCPTWSEAMFNMVYFPSHSVLEKSFYPRPWSG